MLESFTSLNMKLEPAPKSSNLEDRWVSALPFRGSSRIHLWQNDQHGTSLLSAPGWAGTPLLPDPKPTDSKQRDGVRGRLQVTEHDKGYSPENCPRISRYLSSGVLEKELRQPTRISSDQRAVCSSGVSVISAS